ncbi:MAG: ankyrin repeat domain-containing protein [Betaproteobacteria bacterium]|nr:ankyrin repeat domain-containing protein [Betaproteobacteria bacterium]
MGDHLNVVDVLLDQAAEVNVKDQNGDMALHCAVMANVRPS